MVEAFSFVYATAWVVVVICFLGPNQTRGGDLLLLGCNGTWCEVLRDRHSLNVRGCVNSCPLVGLGLLPKNSVNGNRFKNDFNNFIAVANGHGFIKAKAYNDSKLVLMIIYSFFQSKFHKSYGVTFSSIYPGCINEILIFQEMCAWFRKYFSTFIKYITGEYMSMNKDRQQLFWVAQTTRLWTTRMVVWTTKPWMMMQWII